jgi:hypothetical protein
MREEGKGCLVICPQSESSRSLVDGDAARLVLLGLLDRDGQDAIVERGPDRLIVDAGGEVEGARKGADVALDQVVLSLGSSGGLLLLLGCGSRGLDGLGHGRGGSILGSAAGGSGIIVVSLGSVFDGGAVRGVVRGVVISGGVLGDGLVRLVGVAGTL